MKRIEVSWSHDLQDEESVLLDNHSFLNILNVLELQLSSVLKRIKHPDLQSYCDFCLDILIDLSSPDFPRKLPVIEERFGELVEIIKDLQESTPDEVRALQGILETLEVALARTKEFGKDRFRWSAIKCADLQAHLVQFLSATEKVGRGRFHFVYAPRKAGAADYQIDFGINARNAEISCPLVLHDTLRDLVGNARKYSPPGTCIRIRLDELREGGLRLVISDQGMGIPEDELEKVVQYGYRATNALDHKTLGGGLGLTKAYLISKRYGGRFFIASSEGKGTTVELTLLRPSNGIP